MKEKEITEFTVHITSVKDATWQGTVAAEDDLYHFQSEMQLLKWLWKKYPQLKQDN